MGCDDSTDHATPPQRAVDRHVWLKLLFKEFWFPKPLDLICTFIIRKQRTRNCEIAEGGTKKHPWIHRLGQKIWATCPCLARSIVRLLSFNVSFRPNRMPLICLQSYGRPFAHVEVRQMQHLSNSHVWIHTLLVVDHPDAIMEKRMHDQLVCKWTTSSIRVQI